MTLAVEKHTPKSPPEVQLWSAVLMQALLDATSSATASEMGAGRVNRHRARRWLRSNCHDFQRVCVMAGINPDVMKARADQMSKAGWHRILLTADI